MSKWVQMGGAVLVLTLTACTKEKAVAPPSARIGSITQLEASNTLPPAVLGNVEFSPSDEAPILTNEEGISVRKDRESQNPVIYFSGYNEEPDF